MQPNYDELMWKSFDENFKLNYALILRSMTSSPLGKSSHIVNTFGIHEVAIGKSYVKIADLLLEQENIENDILMPISTTEIGFKVHSIGLKNYFETYILSSRYTSVDEIISKNS